MEMGFWEHRHKVISIPDWTTIRIRCLALCIHYWKKCMINFLPSYFFTWHFRCPILTSPLELASAISFIFPPDLAHLIYEGITGEEIKAMEDPGTTAEWLSDAYQKSNFNMNVWWFENSEPQTSRRLLSRCIASLLNATFRRFTILKKRNSG